MGNADKYMNIKEMEEELEGLESYIQTWGKYSRQWKAGDNGRFKKYMLKQLKKAQKARAHIVNTIESYRREHDL